MHTTTHRFQVIAARATYTCPCSECEKLLKRTARVEHTVNPYNKNADGSVKTQTEVYRSAQAEADKQAQALQGVPAICSTCEDAPNRELLLQMAADPHTFVKPPERYWNSPLHVLVDRGQAMEEHIFLDGNCYNYADENWISQGYRITPKGLKRAAQHLKVAAS